MARGRDTAYKEYIKDYEKRLPCNAKSSIKQRNLILTEWAAKHDCKYDRKKTVCAVSNLSEVINGEQNILSKEEMKQSNFEWWNSRDSWSVLDNTHKI